MGSKGDSYDNALAETTNGLYKGRCCINQFWNVLLLSQPYLCHGHRLRTAQFSKFVQNGCPDMQLIDLALEGA
ncbi:hypothetical protein GCM10027513_05210 [Giesbergeria giesbergeri]